jgi:hypothetical protein
MSIGGTNPIPFVLGDAVSPTEASYTSLKSMVGEHGYGSDTGIEGEWRLAKAVALGALSTGDERAVLQAYPQEASDFVPVYEAQFGITTNELEGIEPRAKRIAEQYTTVPRTWGAELQAALTALDPRITLLHLPYEKVDITHHGRPFDTSNEPSRPFAQPGVDYTISAYPNVEGDTTVIVLFELDPGAMPTANNIETRTKIVSLLNTVLPSWCDFTILLDSTPFTLDFSRLDAAGFGL